MVNLLQLQDIARLLDKSMTWQSIESHVWLVFDANILNAVA
jgi:hypothetical protein